MSDATHYGEMETLKNGMVVKVRSIRPGDKAGVADAFGRLGAEAIYTRFFHAKQSLTNEELVAATEVDGRNVVALVVTTEVEGEETIIGGGRYVALAAPGPRAAEIAFLVDERYQGLGIAGRVLKYLSAIAKQQGVAWFEAEVLPQNAAMLRVFKRSGLPLELHRTEGVVRVRLFMGEVQRE